MTSLRVCDKCRSNTDTRQVGDEAYCLPCLLGDTEAINQASLYLARELNTVFVEFLTPNSTAYLVFYDGDKKEWLEDWCTVPPVLVIPQKDKDADVTVVQDEDGWRKHLIQVSETTIRAIANGNFMAIVVWRDKISKAGLQQAVGMERNVLALEKGLTLLRSVDPQAVAQVQERLQTSALARNKRVESGDSP